MRIRSLERFQELDSGKALTHFDERSHSLVIAHEATYAAAVPIAAAGTVVDEDLLSPLCFSLPHEMPFKSLRFKYRAQRTPLSRERS